jgi:hypothetical protein
VKQRERTDDQESSGHIFLVRVWPGEGMAGGAQWRGKVQNIVHGEASNFADLPALVDCLLALLPGQAEGQVKSTEEEER